MSLLFYLMGEMRMQRRLDLLNFRSSITHSIAQNLVINEHYDMYSYLNEWTKLLLDGYNYTLDEVNDVIVYSWNHAQEEAAIVRQMYQQQGIVVNVSGHGGSQIKPEILLEIASTKENN